MWSLRIFKNSECQNLNEFIITEKAEATALAESLCARSELINVSPCFFFVGMKIITRQLGKNVF